LRDTVALKFFVYIVKRSSVALTELCSCGDVSKLSQFVHCNAQLTCVLVGCFLIYSSSLKVIAHWVWNFSMRFSRVFFRISILSYQNACQGLKNAKNRTWSGFFSTDECFGGSVQTWLTEHEVLFIFIRARCAMTFRLSQLMNIQYSITHDTPKNTACI